MKANGWLGAALAAAFVALAFLTSSSIDQTVTAAGTWSEVALTLLGAGAGCAVIVGGPRGRAWGIWPVALFAVFTAFAALSILWSVQPDWSWFGANQLVAYLAVFGGTAALARLFPERWPAVIGGIAAASAGLCAWSLVAKVFPSTLASATVYGRLQAPFGYWNAIGVVAAFGTVCCLWSAGRREGGRLLRGLSIPALTLTLSAVVLSLSRTALLVAAVGVVVWIAISPRRLRAVLALGLGGVGALPVVLWVVQSHALSGDDVSLSIQDPAGHRFGLVLVVVIAAMTLIGAAFSLAGERLTVSRSVSRRLERALLVAAALVPVAAIVALALSSRGLFGEISHGWQSLINPNSVVGNTPGRILQFGSSRPLYWKQGFDVGDHALLKGVGELGYGVARLRYTTEPYKADQAHSYPIQTFADLGLVGVAITLALLVCWIRAAARTLTPWRRPEPSDRALVAEHEGLAALAVVVVVFGIQSSLDFTWFFTGVSVPVLVAAGWLAGRGPLAAPIGRGAHPRPLRERPAALASITALVAVALCLGWIIWQPLRSADASAAAVDAASDAAAFRDARTAIAEDPLAIDPLFQLSTLYSSVRDIPAARRQLVAATRLQPDNPHPWAWLAVFDFQSGNLRPAIADARQVLALDHTPDSDVAQARSIIAQAAPLVAQAPARRSPRLAQRVARARSSRRHSGGPPA